MARSVVSTAQVAHLWAAQTQDAAWTASRNISFNGAVLRSYAKPIAAIHKRNGAAIVLLTTRKWSVTTSSHVSKARYAVSYMTTFHVPHVAPSGAEHAANLAVLVAGYRDALAHAGRATATRESGSCVFEVPAIRRAHESAVAYADFFGIQPVVALPDLDSDINVLAVYVAGEHAKFHAPGAAARRRVKAAAAKAQAATAKDLEKARRAAEAAQTASEAITAWRAGTRHTLPYDCAAPGGLSMLRVRGDALETSQGAKVPLDDAVRVFQFVKMVRQAGTAWQANGAGVRVGGFQVTSISADGTMRAGCHLIPWPEIEAAAGAAGVLDIPASDEVVAGGV